KTGLVFQFRNDKVAVQASNVADGNILRAFSFARTSVCTVTETEFVHLAQHSLGTAQCFRFALGQQVQLAHLGRNEQHSRTVLTSSHTSTTTDTAGSIHSLVSDGLRNQDSVGILGSTGTYADVAACLHNLVVGRTVDHQVLDNRETGRAPRFNSDGIAVVE